MKRIVLGIFLLASCTDAIERPDANTRSEIEATVCDCYDGDPNCRTVLEPLIGCGACVYDIACDVGVTVLEACATACDQDASVFDFCAVADDYHALEAAYAEHGTCGTCATFDCDTIGLVSVCHPTPFAYCN